MNHPLLHLTHEWTSGLRVSPSLEDLSPVLAEWQTVYACANETYPQTNTVWYIENTLSSLLSAAAWRLGLPSIAEVKTDRTYSDRKSAGHMDLAIAIGGALSVFEAKLSWFDDIGAFEKALTQLANARSNVGTLPQERARRIALSFAVFEKGRTPLDALLASAIERAEKEKPDLLTWALMRSPPANFRYPGCMMIGSLLTE